jgi:hypothetical protein
VQEDEIIIFKQIISHAVKTVVLYVAQVAKSQVTRDVTTTATSHRTQIIMQRKESTFKVPILAAPRIVVSAIFLRYFSVSSLSTFSF